MSKVHSLPAAESLEARHQEADSRLQCTAPSHPPECHLQQLNVCDRVWKMWHSAQSVHSSYSDYKCRGQLGQISGKCTLGYYDTLAFSLRKSKSATWCMLVATCFRRQEGSSRPSMASSVCESINRTRCIRTSVKYNILLVYRNLPKRYRTAMICPDSSLY